MSRLVLLPLQKLAKMYDAVYTKSPMVTAGCTMGFKAGGCDIVAQKFENPEGSLDVARIAKFSLFCLAYVGAFQHIVFNVVYTKLFPGAGILVAAKKTLFDNFVHSPFLYLPSYYTYKSMVEGGSVEEGLVQYRNEGMDVLKACWALWIPAQLAIFYVLPPNFRIVANAVVGCLWEVGLSYLSPLRPDAKHQ